MYPKIKYWLEHYALNSPDNRAVGDFIECESNEVFSSFRNEIIGISRGSYQPDTLDQLLGRTRAMRYESYDEWAKMVLIWIADYRK